MEKQPDVDSRITESVLAIKIARFHRLGHKFKKKAVPRTFTVQQFLARNQNQNTNCYLSGRQVNLADPTTYSLDHIIPLARGGKYLLENAGVCAPEVNQAKHKQTPEEFVAMCKDVLVHHGYTVIPPTLPSSTGSSEF